MRLWDYRILPYLPKSQILAQWRELNSIFKKQDKHILINYVYEYPKENLLLYTHYVMVEMIRRGYKIKSLENYKNYFGDLTVNENDLRKQVNPFPQHHTETYLLICFMNLYEKYKRNQKDFTFECFNGLCEIMSDYYDLEELKEYEKN